MIFFYKVITTCLYPILVIFIYFRKFKNKEHGERYKEKFFPHILMSIGKRL